MIYSANHSEHDKLVSQVLAWLFYHNLFAKLEKCSFDQDCVEFLGYMVTPQGILMDPKKVDTLLSWSPPKSVHDVQSFLGFANFYQIFVKDFSGVASPLIALTGTTKAPFSWNPRAQSSFDALK